MRCLSLRTLGRSLLLKAGTARGLGCMGSRLLSRTTNRLLAWTLSGLRGARGGCAERAAGWPRAESVESDADRTIQGVAQAVVYDSAGADRKR